MSQPNQQGGRAAQMAKLRDENLRSLRGMFAKIQGQLAAALPHFITPERMIRVATTTVQRVPALLECDPVTVIGALMQSAQLGLEPDNVTGNAYLVPFWSGKNQRLECSLIPGYRGLMALARRSKEIGAFDARVVKRGEVFDFEYGSRQFLRHKPSLEMERSKDGVWVPKGGDAETVAAYAIAFYAGGPGRALPDGSPMFQFHVMSRPQLEDAKQFTKSRNREGEITGPWIEHEDPMFVKTVIRRAAKLLPFSVELMTAVGLEERAIGGKSQGLGVLGAEALGMENYNQASEDEDETAQIDPELSKAIDDNFAALNYTPARRTVKLNEYKGRLPELLEWLKAEVLKGAKSAGAGKSDGAASGEPAAAGDASTGDGPAGQGETKKPEAPANRVIKEGDTKPRETKADAGKAKGTGRGGKWRI